jgi:diguanylate cyclase (GGDEF)-like protein
VCECTRHGDEASYLCNAVSTTTLRREPTMLLDASDTAINPRIIALNNSAKDLLGQNSSSYTHFGQIPFLRRRSEEEVHDKEKGDLPMRRSRNIVDEQELARLLAAFETGQDAAVHLALESGPRISPLENLVNIVDIVMMVRPLEYSLYEATLVDTRVVHEKSRRDQGLTMLYTKNVGKACIDELNRMGHQFAIIFADVDDFKRYNTKYSHSGGDKVLTVVAEQIQELGSREGSLPFRYAGDEFMIIIPCLKGEIDFHDRVEGRGRVLGASLADLKLELLNRKNELEQVAVTISHGIYFSSKEDAFFTSEEILHKVSVRALDSKDYRKKKRGKSS